MRLAAPVLDSLILRPCALQARAGAGSLGSVKPQEGNPDRKKKGFTGQAWPLGGKPGIYSRDVRDLESMNLLQTEKNLYTVAGSVSAEDRQQTTRRPLFPRLQPFSNGRSRRFPDRPTPSPVAASGAAAVQTFPILTKTGRDRSRPASILIFVVLSRGVRCRSPPPLTYFMSSSVD